MTPRLYGSRWHGVAIGLLSTFAGLAVAELIVGREFETVDAGVGKRGAELGFAAFRPFPKALAKTLVLGVDEKLLAGLRILQYNEAQVGQLEFHRIEEPRRDDLVPSGQQAERLAPAWRADEVRDDEYRRATLDRLLGFLEQPGQIGLLAVRLLIDALHPVEQVQHLAPSAARGDDLELAIAIDHRAHAIAVAGQQAREHGDQFDRQLALFHVARPEVHRPAQIEQKPGGDLAILLEFPDIRSLHPRSDVPVDVAHVVPGLVLAQAGEVHAVAPEQAPVVALEEAVQAADDLPVEALEDALRRWRGRWSAPGGGRRGPARRPGSS